MTSQLKSQRDQLLAANDKIDERRRFTEAVLSGVSAGVIGLDGNGAGHAGQSLGARRARISWRTTWSAARSSDAIPALAPVLEEAQAAESAVRRMPRSS